MYRPTDIDEVYKKRQCYNFFISVVRTKGVDDPAVITPP